MATERAQCIGITTGNERCKNYAKEGSEYCHWHDLPEEEQDVVGEFLREHWKAAVAFFTGALGEAAMGDLYAQLKELAGIQSPEEEIVGYLETLTSAKRSDEVARIRKASQRFKKRRRYDDLKILVPSLNLGMTEAEVEKLLGKPDSRKEIYGPRYRGIPPRPVISRAISSVYELRDSGSSKDNYSLALEYTELASITRIFDPKDFPLASISLEHP